MAGKQLKVYKYGILLVLSYISFLGYARIFAIASEEVDPKFIAYNISVTIAMLLGVTMLGAVIVTIVQNASKRGTGKFTRNLVTASKVTLSTVLSIGYVAYVEMLPTMAYKIGFFLLPAVAVIIYIWKLISAQAEVS